MWFSSTLILGWSVVPGKRGAGGRLPTTTLLSVAAMESRERHHPTVFMSIEHFRSNQIFAP